MLAMTVLVYFLIQRGNVESNSDSEEELSSSTRRKAEKAAEGESMEEQPTAQNILKEVTIKLKKKRKHEKRLKGIHQLMIDNLGSKDAVIEEYVNKKRTYSYRCPMCNANICDKLPRHLVLVRTFNKRK